jgi:hypothetical protein
MRGDWCSSFGRQSQRGGENGGKINILGGKNSILFAEKLEY